VGRGTKRVKRLRQSFRSRRIDDEKLIRSDELLAAVAQAARGALERLIDKLGELDGRTRCAERRRPSRRGASCSRPARTARWALRTGSAEAIAWVLLSCCAHLNAQRQDPTNEDELEIQRRVLSALGAVKIRIGSASSSTARP